MVAWDCFGSLCVLCDLCGQLWFSTAFAKLRDGIAREFHRRVPEIRRQAAFVFEMAHEGLRIGEFFPHLRQKGAAVMAVFENHAVDAGAQLRQRIGFALPVHDLDGREHRDFDFCIFEFIRAQRFEARVAEGGGFGIGGEAYTEYLSLLLAAMNVFYRDAEQVLEVGLTAWFFLTPVFYELELLPNQVLGIDVWRLVYTLNPMATLVTDYRYVMLYQTPIIRHTLVPFVIGCVLLAVGWWTFRRVAPAFERVPEDVVRVQCGPLPGGIDHPLRHGHGTSHRLRGTAQRQRVAPQRHAHREQLLQLHQIAIRHAGESQEIRAFRRQSLRHGIHAGRHRLLGRVIGVASRDTSLRMRTAPVSRAASWSKATDRRPMTV